MTKPTLSDLYGTLPEEEEVLSDAEPMFGVGDTLAAAFPEQAMLKALKGSFFTPAAAELTKGLADAAGAVKLKNGLMAANETGGLVPLGHGQAPRGTSIPGWDSEGARLAIRDLARDLEGGTSTVLTPEAAAAHKNIKLHGGEDEMMRFNTDLNQALAGSPDFLPLQRNLARKAYRDNILSHGSEMSTGLSLGSEGAMRYANFLSSKPPAVQFQMLSEAVRQGRISQGQALAMLTHLQGAPLGGPEVDQEIYRTLHGMAGAKTAGRAVAPLVVPVGKGSSISAWDRPVARQLSSFERQNPKSKGTLGMDEATSPFIVDNSTAWRHQNQFLFSPQTGMLGGLSPHVVVSTTGQPNLEKFTRLPDGTHAMRPSQNEPVSSILEPEFMRVLDRAGILGTRRGGAGAYVGTPTGNTPPLFFDPRKTRR